MTVATGTGVPIGGIAEKYLPGQIKRVTLLSWDIDSSKPEQGSNTLTLSKTKKKGFWLYIQFKDQISLLLLVLIKHCQFTQRFPYTFFTFTSVPTPKELTI